MKEIIIISNEGGIRKISHFYFAGVQGRFSCDFPITRREAAKLCIFLETLEEMHAKNLNTSSEELSRLLQKELTDQGVKILQDQSIDNSILIDGHGWTEII